MAAEGETMTLAETIQNEEPEIRRRAVEVASKEVKRRQEHRERQTDTILDILCGLLLYGFGVFSGIALMGGLN